MEDSPAVEAVGLGALLARELRVVSLPELERHGAIRSGTPRQVLISLHGLLVGELVVLVPVLLAEQVVQVVQVEFPLALDVRALQGEFGVFDLSVQEHAQAFIVEHVLAAGERKDVVLFEAFVAHLADEVDCFYVVFVLHSLLDFVLFLFLQLEYQLFGLFVLFFLRKIVFWVFLLQFHVELHCHLVVRVLLGLEALLKKLFLVKELHEVVVLGVDWEEDAGEKVLV